MDPVSGTQELVRAERSALSAGIGSVRFAFCFHVRPEIFFVRYRRGMAFFTNGQRGKTVQCVFCHGIALIPSIFKTWPVYAPHIGAAEEILKLIYVQFYFGNFQLGAEARQNWPSDT